MRHRFIAHRGVLFVFCATFALVVISCSDNTQPNTRKEDLTLPVLSDTTQSGGMLDAWPDIYRKKAHLCVPLARNITKALSNEASAGWEEFLPPAGLLEKYAVQIATATKTSSAIDYANAATADHGAHLLTEMIQQLKDGLARTRQFLIANEFPLAASSTSVIWPSDDPKVILRPDSIDVSSQYHVVSSGWLLGLRVQDKTAVIHVGALWEGDKPFVVSLNPLAIIVSNGGTVVVTGLVYPAGYEIWEKDIPLDVPAVGINWSGPGARGIAFLTRASYELQSNRELDAAQVVAMQMQVISLGAHQQFVAWTQHVLQGDSAVQQQGDVVFDYWAKELARVLPSMQLSSLRLERWDH